MRPPLGWRGLVWATLLGACSGTIVGDERVFDGTQGGKDVSSGGGKGGTEKGNKTPQGEGGAGAIENRDCPTTAPLPRRIRSLNSDQYARSIQATLGSVDVSPPFPASDRAAQFSTNADLRRLDFKATQAVLDNAKSAAAAALPALKKRFDCLGKSPSDAACIQSVVKTLGRELYRAPLAEDQNTKLQGLFSAALAKSDPDAALGLTVRAMLSSPRFIFRQELGQPDGAGGFALTPHENASVLSYALTNGPPDEELRQAADDGALSTPTQIRGHAERLMRRQGQNKMEIAAGFGIEAFVGELFDGGDVVGLHKDPKTFPDFDDKTRKALFADYQADIKEAVSSSAPTFANLLTGKTHFVRPASATFLGWDSKLPAEGSRIAVPETQRIGLLTHPVLMATYAHENESNPVARGHFVSDKLLCVDVPPPPAVVVFPDRANEEGKTLRQVIESVHSVDSCAACHKLMDPMGFPFEVFDAVGRYREKDRGQPIDASGAIAGTEDVDGPVTGVDDMLKRIAKSSRAHECFSQRTFLYLAGEEKSDDLACQIAPFAARFNASQGDIPSLFADILASDFFTTRAAE